MSNETKTVPVELKPCPCGAIPNHVSMQVTSPRFVNLYSDCLCGWKLTSKKPTPEQVIDTGALNDPWAVNAWNSALRKEAPAPDEELEARLEFKQKNTDALIARWEPYIKQLEEENQRLKDALVKANNNQMAAAQCASDFKYGYEKRGKEIEELEAKHQWQPIETAPKDGTEIFIFRVGWPWAPVAKWVEYPGNPVLDDNNEECCMYGWLFDEWFTPGNEDGWLGWSDDEMPTYWMPLPEPPQQKKDDE